MNQTLTSAFKDTIKELNLIDTGTLLNESVVEVNANDIENIQLNIISTDYLQYLINEYPIIETWTNKSEVSSEIQQIIQPILENKINSYINGEDASIDIIPRVYVTINGV